MLSELRQLSLDYLWGKFGGGKPPPPDLPAWFRQLTDDQVYEMLPEPDNNVKHVYVLRPDNDSDLAILEIREHKFGNEPKYPFVKVPSQKAYFGTCMKRTINSQTKNTAPNSAKVQRTLDAWKAYRDDGSYYSEMFGEFLQVAERSKIRIEGQDEEHTIADHKGCKSILDIAVKLILDTKTCFLVVTDLKGTLPGELETYRKWFLEKEIESRYTTQDIKGHDDGTCSLCGQPNVTIYPQGVKGAGINIFNQDRPSAFVNSDLSLAWKSYGICVGCCRILTLSKFWVIPKLKTNIAGAPALVIPSISAGTPDRHNFLKEIDNLDPMINPTKKKGSIKGGTAQTEKDLLEDLAANDSSLVSLKILWGKFGQDIGDIVGLMHDIIPSRMRDLSALNIEANDWNTTPVFPTPKYADYNAEFTLGMRCLKHLFSKVDIPKKKSTGGPPHPDDTEKAFSFRHTILECIYHQRRHQQPHLLWDEIYRTARSNFRLSQQAAENLYSTSWASKPHGKQAPYGNVAMWAKHMARFLHYLRHEKVGVLPMCDPYVPTQERLAHIFDGATGIDTPSKAFAFLLGAMHAKLMYFQKIDSRSISSLAWLERLQLSADQLPHLYIKVRDQLQRMEYGDKLRASRSDVKTINEELSRIGLLIGDQIDLTQQQTNYFLLLGQGVSFQVGWPLDTEPKNGDDPKEAASDA